MFTVQRYSYSTVLGVQQMKCIWTICENQYFSFSGIKNGQKLAGIGK